MEDVVAKLPAHMFIRHKTYAVRVPIPTDIQGILDKKEITRSLKSRNLNQAKKNYHEKMAEIYKVFEQARSKLEHSVPASLVGFYPLEVVKAWYHVKRLEIGSKGKGGFEDEAQRQSYILGLKSDLVDLTASEPKRHSFVGFTAFSLLEAAGYPMKPGTSVPNVNFDDPKYISLLDHLVVATIELREFELEVLGQKVSYTPNGGIYKSYTPNSALEGASSMVSDNSVGTPLCTLINEYMDHKGGDTKKTTAKAKRVAFEYLTSIVGKEYFVENLNRSHFLQIRKILSAYPKNAKKLKVLKGMSLTEKSDYAQKHNLPLMSKQNANKIIMRLKSLMRYAVDTDRLLKNPCSEIEFKITQAEKDAAAREKFSDTQLNKLFTSEAFDPSYPKGAGMFWVPILALFHGFRMEEILIITLKQVKVDAETDTHYFDLTEFTTDDVKNKNAMRRVPFHPELERLGFFEYLKKCKNHKGLRLFPKLKKSQGDDATYRKLFSPKFTRYSKKVGVHTDKTVFHSFRHNFAAACLNGEVPTDYENCLAGWSLKGGQNGTYKKPKDASVAVLKKMIDKIEYPTLDLSHLYPVK